MRYQEELKLLQESGEQECATVGKYDALFGRKLPNSNALLSPKLATILKAQKEAQHRMHVHPAENNTKPDGESRSVSQLGSHIITSHMKTLNSEDNGEVEPRKSSRIAYQKQGIALTEELSS